jgi:hypothetical protein
MFLHRLVVFLVLENCLPRESLVRVFPKRHDEEIAPCPSSAS